MIESAHEWRWILYALLLVAAVSDIQSMRIPNLIPLAVVGALLAVLLITAAPPEAYMDAALSSLIGLGVGYGFFRLKLMGGGDGKLFAASAAWFSAGALLSVGFFVSLAGIIVALAALAFRSVRPAAASPIGGRLRAALKAPIPYGVAIAVGVVIASQIPSLG